MQFDEYRKKKAEEHGVHESQYEVNMDHFYKEMKIQRIKRELIQKQEEKVQQLREQFQKD